MAISVELNPTGALDRRTISAVDSTRQVDEVLAVPAHLRDALRRVGACGAPYVNASGGVIVAGMGGSGIGGRLALAALGERLSRPLVVSNGYSLPSWAGPETLVLCSSYSGTTEETLSAYVEAGERGAPRLVATTGGLLADWARRDGVPIIDLPEGLQPRAAVGYAVVVALAAAAISGAAPWLDNEIERAADLLEDLAGDWGPEAGDDSEAKALARALDGTLPVIVGADLAEAAAYRWKCQFNENAEIPAFWSALPEADHNEVVGWTAARSLGRLAYVSLEDHAGHPRNLRRAELTAELAASGAVVVLRAHARGETRLERLLSLVLLGDVVSIYVAVLRGSDPIDIPAINTLKARMRA
jgi:glucose/mannose-6-phosphate isomerase